MPNRNDPCLCGSGKKYKKCCMFKDQPQPGLQEIARSKLVDALVKFTSREFENILPAAYDVFWGGQDPETDLPRDYAEFIDINFNEWLMFDFRADPASGKTIVECLFDRLKGLSETEKAVLNLFRDSVISLFEVQEVFPEEGLILKDLLLGGEYQVKEKSGTRNVTKWDIFASRIIRIDGQYVLNAGVYPYRIGRKQEVLEAVRDEFKEYKRRAPAASLRDFLKAHSEIFNLLWFRDTGVDSLPGIRTRTGEPLMLCKAVFSISDKTMVTEVLKKHDRLEPDDKGGFTWLEDPGRDGALILGGIRISNKELFLECMSKKRLETGKKMILDALRGLAEHKADTFHDPYEVVGKTPRKSKPEKGIPPQIEQELYDKFMRDHMTKWLDEKIPALDGMTPRDCVKTADGRKKVDDLLKSFENLEERKRMNGEPHHDLSWIWPVLGLDRPE